MGTRGKEAGGTNLGRGDGREREEGPIEEGFQKPARGGGEQGTWNVETRKRWSGGGQLVMSGVDAGGCGGVVFDGRLLEGGPGQGMWNMAWKEEEWKEGRVRGGRHYGLVWVMMALWRLMDAERLLEAGRGEWSREEGGPGRVEVEIGNLAGGGGGWREGHRLMQVGMAVWRLVEGRRASRRLPEVGWVGGACRRELREWCRE